eukprot:TRINITY_DN32927_c0_g1_i1.p2 TRINITY_DN32927_c0_g1~~TRINITY_DN32927_c0_g1_i1.p2  ORF type:complete len:214 (+),score=49.06 TRINITY_DN32927_c0_g1_i1:54-695(+)
MGKVTLAVRVVGGPLAGRDSSVTVTVDSAATLPDLQRALEEADQKGALGKPVRWAWVPESQVEVLVKPAHTGEWRGTQVKNWCCHPDRGGVFEGEMLCEHPGDEIKSDHWSCCGRVSEGALGCRWPDGSPCGTVLHLEKPKAPAGPEPVPGWTMVSEGRNYDWDRTTKPLSEKEAAAEAQPVPATLDDLGFGAEQSVTLVWRYGDEFRWYGAP